MASQGNSQLNKGIPEIKDAFVLIVKTEWNAHITDRLEEGVIKVLEDHQVSWKSVVVPGAIELCYAVNMYAKYGFPVADAFIVLGAVVRGDTPHFDYVCKGVTDGVTQLNMAFDVPTIFGVLTVNNEEQALERVGGKHGNKGEEAAITAIKMIALKRSIVNMT